MIILIHLLYRSTYNVALPKVTANESMAHDMVYYIEYCNFQFAVIHCLSIIHLKYYIEDIILQNAYGHFTAILKIAIFAITTQFLVCLLLISTHKTLETQKCKNHVEKLIEDG